MRAAAIGLCLVLCMSTSVHAAPSGATHSELVARADRLLERGRTARALVLLRRAYARSASLSVALKLARVLVPDPGESLQIKVTLREQHVRTQQALELMRLVDALPVAASKDEQPLLRELWRRRAWAQAWCGDFAGAVVSLRERGGRSDAESARALRSVASLALLRDDLQVAENALRAAYSFTPEDGVLASDLAAVLLVQGRADESIPLWEQRLRGQPDDLEARRDLSSALLAAGRGADAVSLLEAERAVCDAARNCAIEAARAALESGDSNRAIERLAGTFAGDAIEALLVLADAHTRLGARERAREAYARILEQNPGHVRARENLRALEQRLQESPAH